MIDLKKYIDYLTQEKISEEDAKKMIGEDKILNSEEKNILYRYCYPRQLKDRELPLRFQEYFKKLGVTGYKVPDFGSTLLIIEASRTEQYGRFIKHLFHAFGDPTKIHPISGEIKEDCPICGKIVYGEDIWKVGCESSPEEKDNKEYLAYGSTESGIVMCLDCLVQLINAKGLIESFDPGYLDWTKGEIKSLKRTWDALKFL